MSAEVIATGEYRQGITVREGTEGTIGIEGFTINGERVVAYHQAEDVVREGESCWAIIRTIEKTDHGRYILEKCNSLCIDFYRRLESYAVQGHLEESLFREALANLESDVCRVLDSLRGEEGMRILVGELILAYSLCYARHERLEEIRVALLSDQDFFCQVQRIIKVFASEAQFMSDFPEIDFSLDLSYTQAYRFSWRFVHFSRATSYCGVHAQKRYDIQRQQEKLKARLEEVVGVPFSKFNTDTILGISGVGKTETIEILSQVAREQSCLVIASDGREFVESLWALREPHLTEFRQLLGQPDRHIRYRYKYRASIGERVHYGIYYEYRHVAALGLFSLWLEEMGRLAPSEKGYLRFLFENMPYMPLVARASSEGVDRFIKGGSEFMSDGEGNQVLWSVLGGWDFARLDSFEGVNLEEDLRVEALVQLDRYFPIQRRSGEIILRSCMEYIEEYLLTHPDLYRTMTLAHGPAVVIDVPSDVCIKHIASGSDEVVREIRVKDEKFFPAQRATWLVLAEILPQVDVVHATVAVLGGEDPAILSEKQVSGLCTIALSFLRVKGALFYQDALRTHTNFYQQSLAMIAYELQDLKQKVEIIASLLC